jgi:hypothetical protein
MAAGCTVNSYFDGREDKRVGGEFGDWADCGWLTVPWKAKVLGKTGLRGEVDATFHDDLVNSTPSIPGMRTDDSMTL